MKKGILVFMFLSLVLVACGGQSATAPVVENEPLDLAAEVDVHTVNEIKDREDVYLLDVREQWEYDEAHIPGVTLLPLGELPNRLD